MLETRRLVKRYSGVTVVKDVSLVVRRGKIVGLLGPNGSGKTTTIRMLTGMLESSSGTVLYNQRDIDDDLVGYRQNLGYVPEEPHLYPFLSGRQYLELTGRLRQLPAAVLDRRFPALFDLFGIRDANAQIIS